MQENRGRETAPAMIDPTMAPVKWTYQCNGNLACAAAGGAQAQ